MLPNLLLHFARIPLYFFQTHHTILALVALAFQIQIYRLNWRKFGLQGQNHLPSGLQEVSFFIFRNTTA
jgi:hypothetical protein